MVGGGGVVLVVFGHQAVNEVMHRSTILGLQVFYSTVLSWEIPPKFEVDLVESISLTCQPVPSSALNLESKQKQ